MHRGLCTISLAAATAAQIFVGIGSVFAQTNYNAQNFSTAVGYKRGAGIISTSQPVALRWQGNDPYSTNTALGETDLVARVPGYTPSPIVNSSLIQGGLGVTSGIFPGTNRVRLWKTFTAPSTAAAMFFAEWSLIPSLEGAPYNRADTFAFDLRNAANTQSLLTLQFTPGISVQSGSYTMQAFAAGSPTQTIVDLSYQSLFQVSVAMTGTNWHLSLAQINSTNRAVLASYTNLAGGILAAGTTALDFATIGLNWDLASTNNLEPGSNYILANQFTVVPEPPAWALLTASALLLAARAGLRRRA